MHCRFVAALAVACVLILQVWSWCRPPCAPWCTIPPVPLRWPMICCFWLCVQCWVLPHCVVVRLCHWRERSVCRLSCKLWACLSNLHHCGLLIPCRLHGKRVRRLLAWLGNWWFGGFAASFIGLEDWDAMAPIGQRRVLSTALPRNKNLLQTCRMNCLALLSSRGAFDSCVAYCFLAPYWIETRGYGAYWHFGVIGWNCFSAFICTLALTSGPGVSCSSSLTRCGCNMFPSNHTWVCNVLPEPVLDDCYVLHRHILLLNCQQPKWIVVAVCRVSKGRVPIRSVCNRVCLIIFQGVFLPINQIWVGHTCLAWL